jgi:hypothetical protein
MSGRPSVLRCCSEWSFLAVLALLLPVIAGHAPFLCALLAGSESSENAAATIDELFADIITIIIVGVFVCVFFFFSNVSSFPRSTLLCHPRLLAACIPLALFVPALRSSIESAARGKEFDSALRAVTGGGIDAMAAAALCSTNDEQERETEEELLQESAQKMLHRRSKHFNTMAEAPTCPTNMSEPPLVDVTAAAATKTTRTKNFMAACIATPSAEECAEPRRFYVMCVVVAVFLVLGIVGRVFGVQIMNFVLCFSSALDLFASGPLGIAMRKTEFFADPAEFLDMRRLFFCFAPSATHPARPSTRSSSARPQLLASAQVRTRVLSRSAFGRLWVMSHKDENCVRRTQRPRTRWKLSAG